MLEHLKLLFKDSVIYGLGGTAVQGLTILLLPVLTRLFDPDEFGTLDLALTITILFAPFLGLGLSRSIHRFYYEAEEGGERRLLTSTGFWSALGPSLSVTLLLVAASGVLSRLVYATPEHWNLLALSFARLPFGFVLGYSQQILRLRRQAIAFGAVSLLQSLVSVGLALFLVVYAQMGITGYVIGFLGGAVLGSILGLFLIRREIVFTLSRSDLRKLLAYGVPLVPIGLAFFVIGYADRFLVARWHSLALLGMYALASKVVVLPRLFVGAFGMAWHPYIMRLFAEDRGYQVLIANVTNYTIVAFAALALAVTVFAPEGLAVIAPGEYAGAAVAVAPLAIAVVAISVRETTFLGIGFSKKTHYLTLVTFATAGLNVLLNFLLIPPHGILGAGIASALSAVFMTSLGYWISQRLWRIPFDLRRILTISACAVLMISLAPLLDLSPLWLNLLVKSAYLLLFPLALIMLRGITDREIRWLWQQVNRRALARQVSG